MTASSEIWSNVPLTPHLQPSPPSLTPLATVGDFTLYERRDRSTAEWRSLKLIHTGGDAGKRKRNWWLGWNGERLSRNTDARHLAAHHPEVSAWVIARLPQGHVN